MLNSKGFIEKHLCDGAPYAVYAGLAKDGSEAVALVRQILKDDVEDFGSLCIACEYLEGLFAIPVRLLTNYDATYDLTLYTMRFGNLHQNYSVPGIVTRSEHEEYIPLKLAACLADMAEEYFTP